MIAEYPGDLQPGPDLWEWSGVEGEIHGQQHTAGPHVPCTAQAFRPVLGCSCAQIASSCATEAVQSKARPQGLRPTWLMLMSQNPLTQADGWPQV